MLSRSEFIQSRCIFQHLPFLASVSKIFVTHSKEHVTLSSADNVVYGEANGSIQMRSMRKHPGDQGPKQPVKGIKLIYINFSISILYS